MSTSAFGNVHNFTPLLTSSDAPRAATTCLNFDTSEFGLTSSSLNPPKYCSHFLDYEEQRDAIQFCKKCSALLCEEHAKLHQSYQKSKNRPLLSVNEITNAKINRKVSCPSHESKHLKYFCCCKKLICSDCAIFYHKNHMQTKIEEAAEAERAHLTKLIYKTIQGIELLKKSLSNVNLLIEGILKKTKNMHGTILSASQRLKDKIDKRANKLIAEIDEKKEQKLDKVKKQGTTLCSLISKAEKGGMISGLLLRQTTLKYCSCNIRKKLKRNIKVYNSRWNNHYKQTSSNPF